MNPLTSALYGQNDAVLLAKATQSSNARAEYIAEQRNEKEEKAAVLNTSLEAQTSNAEAVKPIERLQQQEQAKTSFLTQQIAQETPLDATQEVSDYDKALGEFRDYMDKSAEERYFEAFLKEQGLTKEEFDALPPEEKLKLSKKFEEYVSQKIEEAEAKKQLEEEQDSLS